MSVTLDTNLLLYASDTASPRYQVAQRVLADVAAGPELLYLFWPVLLGYLRIATHPAIFQAPLTVSTAESNIESLLDRRHVTCPGEADGFWDTYRTVTERVPPRGNRVPDAHLAALMRQYDVATIWTHDRDFRRFDQIRVRDPFDTSWYGPRR